MKKQLRRGLALFIAVLMLTCNLPFVALAEGDEGIKISSNVTVSDVEVADDIEFSYYIEIENEPFNGTATGSDGKTYSVVDGILTMPYNASAVLDNVAEGSYYSVKRLTYDNDDYALIKETAPQYGEFTGREYYVSYDGGEKKLITKAEYNAATNNGENTTFDVYVDDDYNQYDESLLETVTTYDVVQGKDLLGNSTYSIEQKECTYIADSIDEYNIKYSVDKSFSSSTKLWVTTYVFSANVAVGIDGFELGADVETTDKPSDGTNTTKKTARESIISNVKTSMTRLAFRVLTENVSAQTGKKAVLAQDVTAMLPDQSQWSDDTETLTYEATALSFKEVTKKTAEYTFVEVPASKDLVFDATFAPAPTGSFTIDFMIYDGALPISYNGATFEIRNEYGVLLNDGEDYNLEINDKAYDVPLFGSIGYTEYAFSGLKHGTYTVQQTKSQDGYIVDKTAYKFNVAREDGAVTGVGDYADNFAKSSFGSYTALTNNTWKPLGLYTFRFFKNNSISITFHKVDQNDEPVEGAEFMLIDRDGLIKFVGDMAKAAPGMIGGLDFNAILDQISGTDWSNIDVGTILGLILSIATLDPSLLPEMTIPAILTSTSDKDGLVELNNSKNILNTLGTVLDSGLVSGEQLAQVIEKAFGSVIPEEYLPLLTTLAEMSDSIHVTTGFKAGSYIMLETKAPTGYEKNSTVFTFRLQNDGTAYLSTGVIFPVIVDAINNQFGVNLTDFFITEEQFEEYAEQLSGAFANFNEYADYVLGNVIDYIGEFFGEGTQVGNFLEGVRSDLPGFYNRYENLEDAIRGLVKQVNDNLSDPIDDDFRYLDTRYFVDINIDIADCLGNAIDGVQYVVTDSEGNVIKLNEDGASVTVPFGDYTIAVTDVPEGYELNDASVTTVTVNDPKGEYTFAVKCHNYNDFIIVSNEDGETHSICCAGYDVCGGIEKAEDCTWEEIDSGYDATIDSPGKAPTYQCTVCGQTKGGDELVKTYNVTIVSKPLGATEIQYYEQGVLKTVTVDASEYDTKSVTVQADHDTQITLTAIPNENVEFVGWMVNTAILNSGNEALDNPHNATVLADITYEPIFQYVYDEDDTFTVVFTDKFGNVYSTQTVDSGDDIKIPDGPVLSGYTFAGWSLTDDEIHALTSATTIQAKYVKNTDVTYTVTAAGATITTVDTEAQDELTGIAYDTMVTVTAEGATAWKIGDAYVAYGESYTFFVGADITLTYETSTVTEKPVVAAVATSEVNSNGYIKASFLATRTMVDGYKYVNAGFIYSTSVDTADLALGSVDQSAVKACYCTTDVEQFALDLGRTSQAGKIYARAFLAYVDESGDGSTEVVYTDFEPFDYDA